MNQACTRLTVKISGTFNFVMGCHSLILYNDVTSPGNCQCKFIRNWKLSDTSIHTIWPKNILDPGLEMKLPQLWIIHLINHESKENSFGLRKSEFKPIFTCRFFVGLKDVDRFLIYLSMYYQVCWLFLEEWFDAINIVLLNYSVNGPASLKYVSDKTMFQYLYTFMIE